MFETSIDGYYKGNDTEVKKSVGFDMLVSIAASVIEKISGKTRWMCGIVAMTIVAKYKTAWDKMGLSMSQQAELIKSICMDVDGVMINMVGV